MGLFDQGGILDPLGAVLGTGPGPDPTAAQNALGKIAGSPFERRPIQKLLPPSLRLGRTGGFLDTGIQGIGDLIKNPGGLNPDIAAAIQARVAQESESVATNFRGLASQQAGSAARNNLPVSIRTALESALGVSQERAQRDVRRDALTESEGLRRQDLGQTFNVLDAILQFLSSGRGQSISGLGASGQLGLGQQGINSQNRAANTALIGSLVSSFAGGGGGGGGGSGPV